MAVGVVGRGLLLFDSVELALPAEALLDHALPAEALSIALTVRIVPRAAVVEARLRGVGTGVPVLWDGALALGAGLATEELGSAEVGAVGFFGFGRNSSSLRTLDDLVTLDGLVETVGLERYGRAAWPPLVEPSAFGTMFATVDDVSTDKTRVILLGVADGLSHAVMGAVPLIVRLGNVVTKKFDTVK